MKRLRHWLFNFAAAVSLILWFIGMLYWAVPCALNQAGLEYKLRSHGVNGKGWSIDTPDFGIRAFIDLNPKVSIPRSSEGVWDFCGFWFELFDPGPGRPIVVVVIPAWFVLLLAFLLPARWVMLYLGPWRHERRLEAGLCPSCGYDLRATPDRCPECGTIPAASKGATP